MLNVGGVAITCNQNHKQIFDMAFLLQIFFGTKKDIEEAPEIGKARIVDGALLNTGDLG